MKKLAITLVVLYVVSQAFDSAIRWLLDMAGIGVLIYVRDLGLILAILIFFALLARDRSDAVVTFWLLAAMALTVCVALFSGLAVPQILFGIKVWLPFVCAFLLAQTGALSRLDSPKAWCTLWALLCSGIFINHFYRYPWIGLTVEVGDLAISANREWVAAGIQRLSGFSRTSVDAASMIILLYSYLIIAFRAFLARLTIIIVSGAAIVLTTSKGAVAAFLGTLLLLPPLAMAKSIAPRMREFLAAGLILIAAIGAIVPCLSLELPFPRMREGSPESWLLGSLLARAWDMWPRALELLSQWWQILAGRGMGGIGSPQGLFEVNLANSADNLFVYMYVTAGVLGGALYVFLACSSLRLRLDVPAHRVAYFFLYCVFAYGLTTNMVETPVFALVLGGLLSTLLRKEEPQAIPHLSLHST